MSQDLGGSAGPNSYLISDLNKVLWLLTGDFGMPGAMQSHTWLAPLGRYETDVRRTPMSDTSMPAGLVSCNVVASRSSPTNPERFRAMMINCANPGALDGRLGRILEPSERSWWSS